MSAQQHQSSGRAENDLLDTAVGFIVSFGFFMGIATVATLITLFLA